MGRGWDGGSTRGNKLSTATWEKLKLNSNKQIVSSIQHSVLHRACDSGLVNLSGTWPSSLWLVQGWTHDPTRSNRSEWPDFLKKLPNESSEFSQGLKLLGERQLGLPQLPLHNESWAWSLIGSCWHLLNPETNQTCNQPDLELLFQFHAAWYSPFLNLKPLS